MFMEQGEVSGVNMARLTDNNDVQPSLVSGSVQMSCSGSNCYTSQTWKLTMSFVRCRSH